MSFVIAGWPHKMAGKTGFGRISLWLEEYEKGKVPAEVEALKTTSAMEQVSLLAAGAVGQQIMMPYSEFLQMVEYMLTNEDIQGDDDPRLRFLQRMRTAKFTNGWEPKGKRIVLGR